MDSKKNHAPLILASASPRRRMLMKQHGYRFRIQVSHVAETHPKPLPSPSALVRLLARKKAFSIARKNPHGYVVAADTLVFLKGRPIGKPRDEKHAQRMLRSFSGRWQQVLTGVSVMWDGGKRHVHGVARSSVLFRALTEAEIKFAAAKNLDKAGGYAVQEKKDGFVAKIRGDYDNVVGLPMRLVGTLLRRSGWRGGRRI